MKFHFYAGVREPSIFTDFKGEITSYQLKKWKRNLKIKLKSFLETSIWSLLPVLSPYFKKRLIQAGAEMGQAQHILGLGCTNMINKKYLDRSR